MSVILVSSRHAGTRVSEAIALITRWWTATAIAHDVVLIIAEVHRLGLCANAASMCILESILHILRYLTRNSQWRFLVVH